MEEPAPESQGLPQAVCPGCGEVVPITEPAENVLICRKCGEQFFVAAGDDSSNAPAELDPSSSADSDHAPAEDDRDAELSGMRIRQISSLRRGIARTRSYYLIALAVCIGGVAQLVFLGVESVRAGRRSFPVLYAVMGLILLSICPRLIRRIRQLSVEMRQTAMPPPDAPPDFSSLSDGTQRWESLGGTSTVSSEEPKESDSKS
jgi:hypothetical protein